MVATKRGDGRVPSGSINAGAGRNRARASRASSPVAAVLDSPIEIDGADAPLERGLRQRIFEEALAGGLKAIRTVLGWILERERFRLTQTRKRPPGPMPKFLFKPSDPRDADEAMILLEIVREGSPDWYNSTAERPVSLETWAIEAAFSRLRSVLTEEQIGDLKRHAADPDGLTWPRRYR